MRSFGTFYRLRYRFIWFTFTLLVLRLIYCTAHRSFFRFVWLVLCVCGVRCGSSLPPLRTTGGSVTLRFCHVRLRSVTTLPPDSPVRYYYYIPRSSVHHLRFRCYYYPSTGYSTFVDSRSYVPPTFFTYVPRLRYSFYYLLQLPPHFTFVWFYHLPAVRYVLHRVPAFTTTCRYHFGYRTHTRTLHTARFVPLRFTTTLRCRYALRLVHTHYTLPAHHTPAHGSTPRLRSFVLSPPLPATALRAHSSQFKFPSFAFPHHTIRYFTLLLPRSHTHRFHCVLRSHTPYHTQFLRTVPR